MYFFLDTPFRELNEEIEQQIFKKKKFPDFKDIYNIIEDYNKNNNLNLNSSEIMIHGMFSIKSIFYFFFLKGNKYISLFDFLVLDFLFKSVDVIQKRPIIGDRALPPSIS